MKTSSSLRPHLLFKETSPSKVMIKSDYWSGIAFLSHSRGMRVSECREEQMLHLIRTVGLKACCISMYTVQCRVIVDSEWEFQHSSSHDCTFDARIVSQTRKDKQTNCSSMLSGWPSFTDTGWKREDTFKISHLHTAQSVVRSWRSNSPNWFLSNKSSASVPVVLVCQRISTMRFNVKRSCHVLRCVRTVNLQIRQRVEFPFSSFKLSPWNDQSVFTSVTRCILLASLSLILLSSPVVVHSSCEVPTCLPLPMVSFSFLHPSRTTPPFPTMVSFLSVFTQKKTVTKCSFHLPQLKNLADRQRRSTVALTWEMMWVVCGHMSSDENNILSALQTKGMSWWCGSCSRSVVKTSTYQSEASKFLDLHVITWVLFCLMCMMSWKGGRQAKHGNNTENLMERPWSKSPFCASRKLPAHLGWPHDSCDIVGERQYVQPVNLHVLQQTTKISGCMPLFQSESKRMPIATTSVQASCEASEQDHK